MSTDAVARDAFAQQAVWCARLGSPFTASLMAAIGPALDRSTLTGRTILDWQGQADARADAVPLRLAGALHALARRGAPEALVRAYPPHPTPDLGALRRIVAETIAGQDETIAAWLASPPQTNEVARSAVLHAGFMEIAAATGLPLALFELGASAGLNAIGDRYAYDLGGRRAGKAGAAVLLAPTWTGSPPAGDEPRIVARRACDRAPLDIGKAVDRERLMAYVWADQAERLDRMQAAIAIARTDPVPVEPADAADWVETVLVSPPPAGIVRVLFHSIAYQYFPDATKARIAAHLERLGAAAGRDTPVAWLAFEQFADEGPRLTLRLWPGGTERLLARGDAHGRAVNWLA